LFIELETLGKNDTYTIRIELEILEVDTRETFAFDPPVTELLPDDPFFNGTLTNKMTIDLDNPDQPLTVVYFSPIAYS
jgi:hypothetical protein